MSERRITKKETGGETSCDYPIDIRVMTQYIDEQSSAKLNRHVFSYSITITNCSAETVQLVSRHWLISDGRDNVQEIRGEGVIGKQPYLKMGESFQYSSGAIIATDVGMMKGSYQMKSESGVEFDAPIQPFALVRKQALH